MHDPMVVAHTIIRPWPQPSGLPAAGDRDARWKIRLSHDSHHDCPPECRLGPFPAWKPSSYARFWRVAGRDWYWPSLITIWHVEPGGHDALSVCQRRYQDRDGRWQYTRSWRWHVHHFKIQVHPLQELRRRTLTRCAWCGGRHRKRDPVNVGFSWDPPKRPWWHGEAGLYHQDCSSAASARLTCTCTEAAPSRGAYGPCLRCGKTVHPRTGTQAAYARRMAAVPEGTRPPRPQAVDSPVD